MKISRKDTIIIAVLVNVALLAVLFATASKIEETEIVRTKNQDETLQVAYVSTPSQNNREETALVYDIEDRKQPVDEIDQVLQEYALKQKVVVTDAPKRAPSAPNEQDAKYIDVVVKKGDALEKIAKTYGVKVDDIVNANALESQKLKIGQHLKVPKRVKAAKPEVKTEAPKTKDEPAEYYVIKSGDNPWTVARKFHLKYEDLLRMNSLDEESARNLKIGQKIRIK